MTSYRIAEAARRTGLPTSTLRYYERIGLLPPPARTESGYRAYGARALERLAFIAHAKALGLRLDDIGELADVRDAGSCGPVQTRLRDLVTARVAETRDQAAALMEISADLSSFMSGLSSPEPDAPCGEGCGCPGAAVRDPTLTVLPDLGPDLSCSLHVDDVAGRTAEWQALARQATAREPLEDGLQLTLPAGTDLRPVADLVAREHACCSFFSFTIGVRPDGVTLDISGPPDARSLILSLVEVPAV